MVVLRDKIGRNSWQKCVKDGVQNNRKMMKARRTHGHAPEEEQPLGASSRCSSRQPQRTHLQFRETEVHPGWSKVGFAQASCLGQCTRVLQTNSSQIQRGQAMELGGYRTCGRAATIYGPIQSHVSYTQTEFRS